MVLLVARLAALKEIDLVVNAAPLPLEKAYDNITSTNKQRTVWLKQRESADHELLKRARDLGKQLFGKQGPDDESGLFDFLKEHLTNLNQELAENKVSAQDGGYPGLKEIRGFLATLKKFVQEDDSLKFLKRFVESKNDLLDLEEDSHEVREFYRNHKQVWKDLRHDVDELGRNKLELNAHAEAGPALARLKEILHSPRPYSMLKEVSALKHTVRTANNELITAAQGPAVAEIQGRLDSLKAELEKAGAPTEFLAKVNDEFTKPLNMASGSRSIAHIQQARTAADKAYDRALTEMEKAAVPTGGDAVPADRDGADATTITKPVKTKIKKRRVVEIRKLWTSEFIETKEDMEAFLSTLRQELQATLDADERVQLK